MANFVVGAGVFGTIAVLISNEGVPSGDGLLLFVVALVPALGAVVASVFFVAGRVEKEPELEFERHLMARASTTAFAATALVALALTIVDLVSAEPAPPPVVYLFVSLNAFVFAFMVERRRISE